MLHGLILSLTPEGVLSIFVVNDVSYSVSEDTELCVYRLYSMYYRVYENSANNN